MAKRVPSNFRTRGARNREFGCVKFLSMLESRHADVVIKRNARPQRATVLENGLSILLYFRLAFRSVMISGSFVRTARVGSVRYDLAWGLPLSPASGA